MASKLVAFLFVSILSLLMFVSPASASTLCAPTGHMVPVPPEPRSPAVCLASTTAVQAGLWREALPDQMPTLYGGLAQIRTDLGWYSIPSAGENGVCDNLGLVFDCMPALEIGFVESSAGTYCLNIGTLDIYGQDIWTRGDHVPLATNAPYHSIGTCP